MDATTQIPGELAATAEPCAPAMPEVALPGWTVPGLDYPSFRISLIAKVIDRLSIRALGRVSDLSMAEWRVLSRLSLSPNGLTVGDLAAQAWVDRAEVSRAATALEARGLTGRRANPDDGRAPILYLTPAGRELHEPLMQARSSFHAEIVAGLSDAECEALDALLRKIADRLIRLRDED